MPDLNRRISLLRPLNARTKAAALAAAVAGSTGEESAALAGALLSLVSERLARGGRGRAWDAARRELLGALLSAFADLPPVERCRAVRLAAGDLAAVVTPLAGGSEAARRSVVALARDTRAPEVIRLLGGLAGDGSEGVAAGAIEALERLAAEVAEGGLDGRALGALDGAVCEAVEAGDAAAGRRVYGAALTLAAARLPGVMGWLEAGDPGDRASHLDLRGMVKRAAGAEGRARAVRWLGVEGLGSAALDRLSQASATEEHEAALPLGYLLLNPRRGKRLGTVERARAMLPGAGDVARLGEEARRALPRWFAALPMRPAERAGLLSGLLTDASAAVRVRAAVALGRDVDARVEAFEALRDYAFDRDERVAAVAACALLGAAREERMEDLRPLMRSEHVVVRECAAGRFGEVDAWAWVDGWAEASSAGFAALRLEFGRDARGFVGGVRARMATGTNEQRMRAILLARRFGIEDEVELELLAAAADGDARLAATAARALGGVTAGSAGEALAACARHGDDRVRASAIEAVGARVDGAAVQILLRAAREETGARARANAIRARLKSEGGGEPVVELEEMLRDPRPGHRLSALWVAERLGPLAAAEGIAAMVRGEEDEHVRERARRCARRMLGRFGAVMEARGAEANEAIVEGVAA